MLLCHYADERIKNCTSSCGLKSGQILFRFPRSMTILRDVSLELSAGESLAIVDPVEGNCAAANGYTRSS